MRDLDNEFLEVARENKLTDGTTCLVALILQGKLFVSNIGDSSAFLVRKNKTIQLNTEHSPQQPEEFKRIEKLGGVVLPVGKSLRVEGVLSVSRAIGDLKYKNYITSDPDIQEHLLISEDEYLILASDGVAKAFDSERLHELIFDTNTEVTSQEIRAKLMQEVERKFTKDNMSLIVVSLRYYREMYESHINELKISLEKLKTRKFSSRQTHQELYAKQMSIESFGSPVEDGNNPMDMSWTNISTEYSVHEKRDPYSESIFLLPKGRKQTLKPLSPLKTKKNSEKKVFTFIPEEENAMDCM